MIPKARIIEIAEREGLPASTIERDYLLGWVLASIGRHPVLGEWVFKGGTCLKKCFFDTYRFSEDLDFTLPDSVPYDLDSLLKGLVECAAWISTDLYGSVITTLKSLSQYAISPFMVTPSASAKILYVFHLMLMLSHFRRPREPR